MKSCVACCACFVKMHSELTDCKRKSFTDSWLIHFQPSLKHPGTVFGPAEHNNHHRFWNWSAAVWESVLHCRLISSFGLLWFSKPINLLRICSWSVHGEMTCMDIVAVIACLVWRFTEIPRRSSHSYTLEGPQTRQLCWPVKRLMQEGKLGLDMHESAWNGFKGLDVRTSEEYTLSVPYNITYNIYIHTLITSVSSIFSVTWGASQSLPGFCHSWW